MNNMDIKYIDVFANISKDEDTGEFVISTSNLGGIGGGPTVFHSNEDDARKMFEDALKLSFAVRNMLMFFAAIEAKKYLEDSVELKKAFKTTPKIQYA